MARSAHPERGLRLCGIPLSIHPSWALAAALIVYLIGRGAGPGAGRPARLEPYLGGLAVAACVFGSVVLHELAHALMARRHALPVRRITMHFFGGRAEIEAEALTPRTEALIATAGPLSNAALAALFGALWWAAQRATHGAGGLLALCLQLLALVNAGLVLLSALPGYPLDGGRIVRALLWYVTDDLLTATRVASLYGQILGWCLFGGGLLLLLWNDPAWGAGLALCGWFLRLEARRGFRETLWQALGKRLPAFQAAFLRPPRIPAGRTLDEAVDDVLEGLGRGGEGGPSLVVDDGGRVVGILGLDQLRAVKRAQWGRTTAAEAMAPRERVPAIPEDMPLATALATLSEGRFEYGLVIAPGAATGADADTAPIGVVTPSRIVRYLLARLREGRAALENPAGGDAPAGRSWRR
ncbi:MAG: CBS domain-containing protein [Chloroflexota bacterium]|nr:CBS domain-containing protein [Chloroflexota bacterium]